MIHAPVDLRAQLRDIAKAIRIIWGCVNGFAEIFAHLIMVNIKGRGELNIANVISAQVHMHQAWDEIARFRFTIVMYALYQRTGTVTYAYNCNTHFLVSHTRYSVPFPKYAPVYLSHNISLYDILTIPLFSPDCYHSTNIFPVTQL